MSISYPSSVTIVNNISSSGGGDGNATSIVGVPVVTGTLNYGDILIYTDDPTPMWQNYQNLGDYFFPILAVPTNANLTTEQELTRFSFQLPGGGLGAQFKISYSIDANETGSIAISSSVDGIVGEVQVSGTTAVSPTELYAFISSSQPYYLIASSSDTSSLFKVYNSVMLFQA
jgi:hypothetical protein